MGSSPARLVIALSVAATLAIFVVYTALAGNGVANLTPSTVAGHTSDVSVRGQMRNGFFVAERDSLVTKCPSKYAPDSKSKQS